MALCLNNDDKQQQARLSCSVVYASNFKRVRLIIDTIEDIIGNLFRKIILLNMKSHAGGEAMVA